MKSDDPMRPDDHEAAPREPAYAPLLEPLLEGDGIAPAVCAGLERTVPESTLGRDPAYQAATSEAVGAVASHWLKALKQGSGDAQAIPAEAMRHVRRAARAEVSSAAVAHLYISVHRRVGELIVEQATNIDMIDGGIAMRQLRIAQETLLEQLVEAVGHEYDRERERISRASEPQIHATVLSLLRGSAVPAEALDLLPYNVESRWHLAMIATASEIVNLLWRVQARFDCQILTDVCEDGQVWIWVGTRKRIDAATVADCIAPIVNLDVPVGIGESRRSLSGWRQSHREAGGALLRALHGRDTLIHYGQRPVVVAALENETLGAWLRDFLAPLRSHRDGAALMRTLRAYVRAGGNATAAGAALGKVRRQTVGARVLAAERLLGRPVRTCFAELDAALGLEELLNDDRPPG